MNRIDRRTVEIIRQWHEAGMIMPENFQDLAKEIRVAIVCDPLEDEGDNHSVYLIGYAEGVDDTILRLQGQTDKEIAKRVLEEFYSPYPIPIDEAEWLDKDEA